MYPEDTLQQQAVGVRRVRVRSGLRDVRREQARPLDVDEQRDLLVAAIGLVAASLEGDEAVARRDSDVDLDPLVTHYLTRLGERYPLSTNDSQRQERGLEVGVGQRLDAIPHELHDAIRELLAAADACAHELDVGHLAARIERHPEDQRAPRHRLVQADEPLRQGRRQHRYDQARQVVRGTADDALGEQRRARAHVVRRVGERVPDVVGAVRERLDEQRLVEVTAVVVVDRHERQVVEVAQRSVVETRGGQPGLGFDVAGGGVLGVEPEGPQESRELGRGGARGDGRRAGGDR